MKGIKCKNCKNLVDDWCDVKCDSPDPELVRDCIGFEQMTNGDRIRAMNDEELAKFIPDWSYTNACKLSEEVYIDCNNECEKCVAEWLKQPSEVDDGR